MLKLVVAMSNDNADLLFETLDALNKHTNRLNTLDKKSVNQAKQVETIVSTLEKQIEVSTKEVLMKLLEKGNTDKEQLVKDITSVIADSIAQLTINAGDVAVTVETDSIAKAISKLPVNTTNNITIDTTELVQDNKQFMDAFKSINSNVAESFKAMKLLFQEMVKQNTKPIEIEVEPEVKELPITGMLINRDKDGIINSVEFVRN